MNTLVNADKVGLVTSDDAEKLEIASKFLYDLFADDKYHFTLFVFVMGNEPDGGVQAGLSTSMSYDVTRALVLSTLDDEPTSEVELSVYGPKPTLN
jgi:hypothetical protein